MGKKGGRQPRRVSQHPMFAAVRKTQTAFGLQSLRALRCLEQCGERLRRLSWLQLLSQMGHPDCGARHIHSARRATRRAPMPDSIDIDGAQPRTFESRRTQEDVSPNLNHQRQPSGPRRRLRQRRRPHAHHVRDILRSLVVGSSAQTGRDLRRTRIGRAPGQRGVPRTVTHATGYLMALPEELVFLNHTSGVRKEVL